MHTQAIDCFLGLLLKKFGQCLHCSLLWKAFCETKIVVEENFSKGLVCMYLTDGIKFRQ